MKIGMVWDFAAAASHYRVVYPCEMMRRRGHEIVYSDEGQADISKLRECDVVLHYRRCDDETYGATRQLVRAGVPIVYDNDDDYLLMPEEHPRYGEFGPEGVKHLFANTLRIAKLASVMTTTTAPVAARYREHGIDRLEVIPNYLRPVGAIHPGREHEGFVIGWVAGLEHEGDARRIGIANTLERVLARHEDVVVECIGVDLGLSQRSDRYFHYPSLPFPELQDRVAGFDIGLAPLADTAFNRARSDIKVKEYAACGIPWIASPVGPYRGLGESEGGRLVSDDGWFEALDRLVRKGRERKRLATLGRQWARTQTISAVADRYEAILKATALVPAGAG
jgi:glycosyltransferase involved in cell wall biosynthesis